MNENNNGLNNSSVPYKAVNNLNTVIENPNININSAVTNNIMENNNAELTQLSTSSTIMGQQVEENKDIIQNKDSIEQYFDKNQNVQQPVVNNFATINTVDSNNSGVVSNNNSSSELNANNVQYENVYQSNVTNKKKKVSIRIPGEFKTALVIVIFLLILLTIFDNINGIFDYIRNLFGF